MWTAINGILREWTKYKEIGWEETIFTVHEQEQMIFTVQEWERTIFTVHKWKQMILWYGHFQGLMRKDQQWMGNILHDCYWLILPILFCHSSMVIECDFLKQYYPTNLGYHPILSHPILCSSALEW